MKNVLVYVLTFVLAAGFGLGAMFLVRNLDFGTGGSAPAANTPRETVAQVRDVPEPEPAAESELEAEAGAQDNDEEPVAEASGSAAIVVVIDNRKVEDASGSNFKVSGFSALGASGSEIEYRIYNGNGTQIKSVNGTADASGAFELASGAKYYITAVDLKSGAESDPEDFTLGRKLTKSLLESVLNDRSNFDQREPEARKLCASSYKANCVGYGSARTISDVNSLFDDHNELSGKKAVVSNLKYNSVGKVTSFTVTMQ